MPAGSRWFRRLSTVALSFALILGAGSLIAQTVTTGAQRAAQQTPNRTVTTNAAVAATAVRGQIRCPDTIQVKVEDIHSNPPWIQSAATASYARAEVSFINRMTPQIAVCVYTAFGGEFKIQRSLDQPYESCSTFKTQGGTGGVQCR
jgi:hypothetical protein